MGKTPKKRSLFVRAHDMAWSNWKRKSITISAALTFLAMMAGTITKVAEAWPVVEPKLPVTYGTFLSMLAERDKAFHLLVAEHEKSDKDIATVAEHGKLDIQLDLAKGKRDAARSEAYRQQDKMNETSDPEKKAMYRDRMREFDDTKSELDNQIRTLNKLRSQ